jgi:hypothetical protein
MVIGYGDINSIGNKDGNSDGNGNCNGDGHRDSNNDEGRIASSCASNMQCCGRGNTLPPSPWTQRKVHSQRYVMGVLTLLRVFAPFQGGGFLTAHHGLLFVYFLQLLFSLLNNPLFAPHIIQALKNPVSPLMLYLLNSSKNPVSLLTVYPGSYCTFCQGKPGQSLQ